MKRYFMIEIILLGLLFSGSAVLAQSEGTPVPVLVERVEIAGDNGQCVAYPSVITQDEEINDAINKHIWKSGNIEAYQALMQSSSAVGAGVHVDYEVFLLPEFQLLSIAFSANGKMLSGPPSQCYETVTVDLNTGETKALSDLINDMDAFVLTAEQYASIQLEPALSLFMDNSELYPVPTNRYMLCEQGVMLFYENSQFSFLSGYSGSILLPYHLIEECFVWNEENPEAASSFFSVYHLSENSREAVWKEIQEGKIASLPFTLNSPLESTLARLRQPYDAEYYPGGFCYETEDARMLGNLLLSDADEEKVTGIWASNINVHGLIPGITTREEILEFFGDPDFSIVLGQTEAELYRLCAGTSDYYDIENRQFLLHTDEEGLLFAMILK